MRAFAIIILFLAPALNARAQSPVNLNDKVKALLLGSLIGDALGGPIEFQGHPQIQATPHPPKFWKEGETMNESEIQKARERIYFREYKYLRPVPEPYAHWSSNAKPGTITDDSRHKIILMHMLRNALQKNQWPVKETDLAKAYLSWSNSNTIQRHPGYDTLCAQWLNESYKAIKWLLGNRQIGNAYPLQRLWNALPTCYGQMSLLPLAAIYPGEPTKAYTASYKLAYFDNGFARDMNSALVAGLAKALTLDSQKKSNEELWKEVIDAIRNTDPYAYAEVPWSERAVNRWLDLADLYVQRAAGSPAKLFDQLEKELANDIKWEAHVPFVVIFSVLKICQYDPLAALQLSIEWGWDHDSYAQLLGAFVGAIYGTEIFKQQLMQTVSARLMLDYDEDISEWVDTLEKIRQLTNKKQLFDYGN
jgi:ADP-ribosylglycohydrolase